MLIERARGYAFYNGNKLVAISEFVFQMEINEPYELLDITKRQKEMFVFLTRLQNSFWNFVKQKFSKGLLDEDR